MTAADPARPRYLAFLPAFLFAADPNPARYVVKAWPVALLPALVLGILAGLLAPEAEPPDLAIDGAVAVLLVVVVAPLLETLLMTVPLALMARLLGPGPAAVGSALLWAVLHSLAAPIWGLVIWWPFLILSVAMLTWRERGWTRAILVVAAIHALHNSLPALLLLLAAGAPA